MMPEVYIKTILYFGLAVTALIALASRADLLTFAFAESGQSDVSTPHPVEQSGSDLSVTEAIRQRRSVRQFREDRLSEEQLKSLLWAGQGITSPDRRLRAAPSAGGTYPLELFVVAHDGLHRYIPADSVIQTLSEKDLRRSLSDAALGQRSIAQAPVNIVIAADYARTTGRYGDRGKRYVYMEIGHAAQNIHLKAVAMGLDSVPIGAFDDAGVRQLLDLPDNLEPLYIIPVGLSAQ